MHDVKTVILVGAFLLAAALLHGGIYVVAPMGGGETERPSAVIMNKFTGRTWLLAREIVVPTKALERTPTP